MPGVRLGLAGEVQQFQVCSGGEHRFEVHNQPHSIKPWAFVFSQTNLFFKRTQLFIHWSCWVVFPSRTWASGFYSEPFCSIIPLISVSLRQSRNKQTRKSPCGESGSTEQVSTSVTAKPLLSWTSEQREISSHLQSLCLLASAIGLQFCKSDCFWYWSSSFHKLHFQPVSSQKGREGGQQLLFILRAALLLPVLLPLMTLNTFPSI